MNGMNQMQRTTFLFFTKFQLIRVQNIKENEILPFTKSLLFMNHLKKVRIYKSPVFKNDRKTQKDKNLKHLQTSSQFYSLQRKSTDKLILLRSQAYQSLLRYSNSLKSGNSLPQKVNNSPKFYKIGRASCRERV